ncbi:MAG: hypothetical protein KAI29_10015, partial [Cyclobacteriaceae bacterium]|nr:hypothetical protein [Cyclobacteriaceae bacterium]
YSLLWKNPAYPASPAGGRTGRHEKPKSSHAGMHLQLADSIAKNLIIYSLAAFSIPTLLLIIINSESTAYDTFISQLELFTTNRMSIKASSDLTVDLIKSFTDIAGRIGFIIVCFITLRQQIK